VVSAITAALLRLGPDRRRDDVDLSSPKIVPTLPIIPG
jgi:hypothetical protein